ncbi:hypothetical protein ACHWQZ_G006876 [Mnemiopsis leidyi]
MTLHSMIAILLFLAFQLSEVNGNIYKPVEIQNNNSQTSIKPQHLPFFLDDLKQAIGANVRVLKYKVIFYTYDHNLSEVKKWMEKGFNAWNNPQINAHLRKHGCPTLQFVETLGDDYDFAINFDIEFFNKHTDYLFWTDKRNKIIYINDGMDILKAWIAHTVAYGTCEILGCKCTLHSNREIMFCHHHVTAGKDWAIYQPTSYDYRTMSAALGCQTHIRWI